jgi:hypothetical protein
MSLFEFVSKRAREENGELRASVEETEETIFKSLTEAERVIVNRFDGLCQVFDRGVYEFLRDAGLWPRGILWGAEGSSPGVAFVVAKSIARRAIKLVGVANRTAIISSGVYRLASFEEDKVKIDAVKKNGVCRLILYAQHGDHFHILHDCPLSHGTCRCLGGIVPERSTTRRNYIGPLSEGTLTKIIFYYFGKGKWIYYLKIGDARLGSKLSVADQVDRFESHAREGIDTERNVEGCDFEDGLLLESQDGWESDESVRSGSSNKRRRVRRAKETAETKTDVVYRKLGRIKCSPLKDFSRTSDWFDDEFLRNLLPKSNEVTMAFNRVLMDISSYSLRDYAQMYKISDPETADDKYLFGSFLRKQFWDRYFTREESVVWLKKLLIWQLAPLSINENGKVTDKEWREPVYTFMKFLIKFLDRKSGKKNTMYIISAPNAGKTFFCDCIADYFLSVGHLKVWNRTNSFPLEEMDGARVAFWNEPNFESGNIPEMLKLLGGDNLSIAIKYNKPNTVQNVPVIVTSNQSLFPKTPEFNERITYINWRAASILKEVGKKRLHPFALEELFVATENYYEEILR